MKNKLSLFLFFFALTLPFVCSARNDSSTQFVLKNNTETNRVDEVVMITIAPELVGSLTNLALYDDTDTKIPYQYLSNLGKIAFQSSVPAKGTKVYMLKSGTPATSEVKTYAAQKLPATRNDIAWENDLAAYRMYSKILLKTEPNTANGVDLWVKKQSNPMIDKMYTYANYHSEQPEGVDAYSVNGKTLGIGGVVAYAGSKLWMHDPYDECQIIHNGPLYTEFLLKYNKVLIDGDFYVKTVRISTSANGLLNKAIVRFEGKNKAMKIAAGIYLHTNMSGVTPNGIQFTSENNIIGYAENKSEGTVTSPNARFFEGVYMPGQTTTQVIENQLVIMSDYAVGSDFTYYFGGGWNIFPVGRYASDLAWFDALKTFKQTILNPMNELLTLPSKSEVINDAIRVNSLWQSDRAATVLDKLWYSGVYHAGNMLFYSIYPQKSYLDYSKSWATNNAWGIATHATADADSYAAGQTYIDLYNLDAVKEPSKISGIKARIDSKLSDSQSAEWWWIDAMYMAMPAYARMGKLTGDKKYYEKMFNLFKNCRDTLLVSGSTGLWTEALKSQYGNGPIIPGYKNVPDGLYNKTDGLWWRDWGFQPNVPQKRDPNNGGSSDTDTNSEFCAKLTPNGKKIYWGRGNGWAIGAMAHTLTHLPADAPHRSEYIDILQTMAAALKNRQREDGFWNMSLDDADYRPGGETSGTALITYAIAWGINNGLLDRNTYYNVVVRGWDAISKQVIQPSGVVMYIQGEGEAPINPANLMNSRNADKKVAFGVGAVLCAAAEVARLAPGEMPVLPQTPLGLDAVTLLTPNRLKVSFSADIEAISALNAANYQIDGAPTISMVEMSGTNTVILDFSSDIEYGKYMLKVLNVKAEDGSIMDAENSKVFVRTVPLSAVDYQVTVSAIGNQAGNPPTNTVDNSLNTRWAQAGTGQWIQFDLGENMPISAIDIAYYLGTTRYNMLNIQVSNDGSSFTNVLNNLTSSGMTDELERYKFPSVVNARYVRIVCNGNSTGGENWNSVTEVRIRFDESSGVEKKTTKSKWINIHPIPYTEGELTIETTLPLYNARIEISDLSGKLHFSNKLEFTSGKAAIRLNRLSSGVYILTLMDKNHRLNQEIIIK